MALTLNDGYISGLRPLFGAYKSTTVAYTGSTITKVTLPSDRLSAGSYFDFTNSKFTASLAGIYQFGAGITWNQTTGGATVVLQPLMYKNGSYHNTSTQVQYTTQSVSYEVVFTSTLIYLAANDYVELYVYSSYSGDIIGGSTNTYMEGFLVRY